MRRYSEAVKADVRRRMSPPQRQSVARISEELGIRSLWWLINAPQAVVDLGSEGVATYLAPDLRGTVELDDLQRAASEGDLKYQGPTEDAIASRLAAERNAKGSGDLQDAIGGLILDRAAGINDYSDNYWNRGQLPALEDNQQAVQCIIPMWDAGYMTLQEEEEKEPALAGSRGLGFK